MFLALLPMRREHTGQDALGKLGKVRLKSQLSSRSMWVSALQTGCVESNDVDQERMKNRSQSIQKYSFLMQHFFERHRHKGSRHGENK